uniref:Uncharacterized protein n=1 Tax=Talaromyces marneffei PM1 TaxID=1077442 RepID=A0A093UQN1_TALMA
MDTTKNKTNTVNSAQTPTAQTSSTNTGSVEHGSVPAESKRRGSSPNLDPETNVQRGIAGVFPSTFGGDKTTTSTFEKSQGERYGEGFDETGALLKGKFSRDDPPNNQASGSGGGENTTSASQNGKTAKDTNVPSKHSPHNGNHQEGLGHKIIDKAEGIHSFPTTSIEYRWKTDWFYW